LFVFNRESLIKDIGDVIVQHPRQIFVVLLVDTFHVIDGHLLPQHHLVESADKEGVQETTVENSQADHSSNEFKVIQMLRINSRMGVDL
jgi:hypothetical protein